MIIPTESEGTMIVSLILLTTAASSSERVKISTSPTVLGWAPAQGSWLSLSTISRMSSWLLAALEEFDEIHRT